MDPCKPKYSATCGPPQLTLLQFPGPMCTLSAGSAGRAHGAGGVLERERMVVAALDAVPALVPAFDVAVDEGGVASGARPVTPC